MYLCSILSVAKFVASSYCTKTFKIRYYLTGFVLIRFKFPASPPPPPAPTIQWPIIVIGVKLYGQKRHCTLCWWFGGGLQLLKYKPCIVIFQKFLWLGSDVREPEGLLDDGLELPVHSSVPLPMFLEEPVDTYTMKNKPAILYCRAAHALQVNPYFLTNIFHSTVLRLLIFFFKPLHCINCLHFGVKISFVIDCMPRIS